MGAFTPAEFQRAVLFEFMQSVVLDVCGHKLLYRVAGNLATVIAIQKPENGLPN